jgi:hypothetical protein
MSDEKTKARKNIAGLVGFFGGGALGALASYASHRYIFVKNLLNKNSPLHEHYKESLEYLAAKGEEMDETEKLIQESMGNSVAVSPSVARARKYADWYENVTADAEKVKQSPKYLATVEQFEAGEKYTAVEQSKAALEHIRYYPEGIKAVHFGNEGGTHFAELHLYHPETAMHVNENGVLEAVSKPAPKIFGVAPTSEFELYEHEGIRKLNPEQIEKLSETNWFQQAEKTVLAAEEKLAGHYEKIFKSALPKGWLSKHAGSPSVEKVTEAVLLGGLIAGMVAPLFVRGKHTQHVAAQKQQAASAEPSIFS